MLLLVGAVLIGLLTIWWMLSPDSEFKKLGDLLPGPTHHPIFGYFQTIAFVGTETFGTMKKLLDQYGPVVRIWVGRHLIVFLFNPDDLEVIMKSSTLLEKSKFYGFLHPWIGKGLLTSTGQKWRLRRKAITPTFHFQVLDNFLEIFSKNGKTLVEKLMSKVDKGSFDVKPFIAAFTLDVICETAMGVKVNAQTQESNEYRSAVEEMCNHIGHRLNTPMLYFDLIYHLTGQKSKQNRLLKILKGHTQQVLKMKEKQFSKNQENEKEEPSELGIKKKLAFLELLLEMKRNSNPAFQTEEDICEEVDTFMFEGHDTTTSALCFSLDWLAANPDCQEKLYEEVRALYSKDDCDPSMENINDLKYLDMFFKEVERFSPSVPAMARQMTESVQLKSGHTLPSGTTVNFSIMQTHRDEKWFPNPSKFNPENFLPDVAAKRHPFAYVPFSAGPRNCIGQKFATLEIKTTLIKLILNFEFRKDDDFEVIFTSDLVLDSANGHRIKISKRP